MKTALVITFTCKDRHGIVGVLADLVLEHGGNWEQSRMMHMAGLGAGMLRVTIDEASVNAFVASLEAVSELRVLVREGNMAPVPARSMRLEMTGADRIGIVQDIAGILDARHINIEEMTTEQVDGLVADAVFFGVVAELSAQADVDVAELRQALDALARERSVQIHLETVQWEM